jgi:Ca2+-binding EF-hand superfamily protein
MDSMTERQIHEWYQDRLSDDDAEKYEAVMERLAEAHGEDPPRRDIVRVMNAFHADPEDPVDTDQLLASLETEVSDS